MTNHLTPVLNSLPTSSLDSNAFVVILVIDNVLLTNKDPDDFMQQWAKQHTHQLTILPKHPTPTTGLSVFYYLLFASTVLTAAPKEALAAYFGSLAGIDCHMLLATKLLKNYKLACFDMDSTLIKEEVITELAKEAGVGDKVDAITEQAMRGEIDFTTSFGQRVALLQGLPAATIDGIKIRLTLQQGAHATIATLKEQGCHTALISGGFTPFASHIAQTLGIDEYHANALDIADGKLTGRVITPILDGEAKARIVTQIAKRLGIGLDEVICVGDGANDIPMMGICGLSVAYRAKPIVQAYANIAINVTGLHGLLYVLGTDINQATNTLV